MKSQEEDKRNWKGFRASPLKASPMANRYLAAIQHQSPPEWPENDEPPRPPNLPQHAQFSKGEEKTVSTNSMTISSRSAENHYYQLSPVENKRAGLNYMNPSNQRDIMTLLHKRRQLKKSHNPSNNMHQHTHNVSPTRNHKILDTTSIDSADELHCLHTKLEKTNDPLYVTSPRNSIDFSDKKSSLSLNFNRTKETVLKSSNAKDIINSVLPYSTKEKEKKEIGSVKDRISVFDKGSAKKSQGYQFKLNQWKPTSSLNEKSDNSSQPLESASSTTNIEGEVMTVGSSVPSPSKGKARNERSAESTRYQDNAAEVITTNQSHIVSQPSKEKDKTNIDHVSCTSNPWKNSQKHLNRNNTTTKNSKQVFEDKNSSSNSANVKRSTSSESIGQNSSWNSTVIKRQVGNAVQTWEAALKKRNQSGIATTWRKNIDLVKNNIPQYNTSSSTGDVSEKKLTRISSPKGNAQYDTSSQSRDDSPNSNSRGSNIRKKWGKNSKSNNEIHFLRHVSKTNENSTSIKKEWGISPKTSEDNEIKLYTVKDSPGTNIRGLHKGQLLDKDKNNKRLNENVITCIASPTKNCRDYLANEPKTPGKQITKEDDDAENKKIIKVIGGTHMAQRKKSPQSKSASLFTIVDANNNEHMINENIAPLYNKEPEWMIQRKSLKSVKNRTAKIADRELEFARTVEPMSTFESGCYHKSLSGLEGRKNTAENKFEKAIIQNFTRQEPSKNMNEDREPSSLSSPSSNNCAEANNSKILSKTNKSQAPKIYLSKIQHPNSLTSFEKKKSSSIGVKNILEMFESSAKKISDPKVFTQNNHQRTQHQTKPPFGSNLTFVKRNEKEVFPADHVVKNDINSKENIIIDSCNLCDEKFMIVNGTSQILNNKSENKSYSNVMAPQSNVNEKENIEEKPSPPRLESLNKRHSFSKENNSYDNSIFEENDQHEAPKETLTEQSQGESQLQLTHRNQQKNVQSSPPCSSPFFSPLQTPDNCTNKRESSLAEDISPSSRIGSPNEDFSHVICPSIDIVEKLSKVKDNFSDQPPHTQNSCLHGHTPSRVDNNPRQNAQQGRSLAASIKSPPRLNNISSLAVNGDNYQHQLDFSPKSNFSNIKKASPEMEQPKDDSNNASFMSPQQNDISPDEKNASFKLQLSNITGNSEHQIEVNPQNTEITSPNAGVFFGEDDDDDECDGVTLSPSTSEISALTNPSCLESSDDGSSSQYSSSDEDTRAAESADRQSSSVRGPSEASSSQTSEAATPLIHSALGKINFRIAQTSSSETLDVLEETNPFPSTNMFQPLVDDNIDEVNQGLLLQHSHVQAPYRERELPDTEDNSGDGSELMTDDYFSQVDKFPSVADTIENFETPDNTFPSWNLEVDSTTVNQYFGKNQNYYTNCIDWESSSQNDSELDKHNFEEFYKPRQGLHTGAKNFLPSKTSDFIDESASSVKSQAVLTSTRIKTSKKKSEKRMTKINQLLKSREIVKDYDLSEQVVFENRPTISKVNNEGRKLPDNLNRMFVRTHPFHNHENTNNMKIEPNAVDEVNSSIKANGKKKVTRDRKFQSGRAAHIVHLHLKGSTPNYSTQQRISKKINLHQGNEKNLDDSSSSFNNDNKISKQVSLGNGQMSHNESRLSNRFSSLKELRKTRSWTRSTSPLHNTKIPSTTDNITEIKQSFSNQRSYQLGKIAQRARMTVATKSSKASEALVSLVSPYSPKKNTQIQRNNDRNREIKKDSHSRYSRLQMARSRSRTPVKNIHANVQNHASYLERKPTASPPPPMYRSNTTTQSYLRQDTHDQSPTLRHWSDRKTSPSPPPPPYRANAVNQSTCSEEAQNLSPNSHHRKVLQRNTQSFDSLENEEPNLRIHRSLTPSRRAILAARRDTEERSKMRLSNISLRSSPHPQINMRENVSKGLQSTAKSSSNIRRLSGSQHSRPRSAESMQYNGEIPLVRSTSRERIINSLQRKRTGDRIGRIKSSSHV